MPSIFVTWLPHFYLPVLTRSILFFVARVRSCVLGGALKKTAFYLVIRRSMFTTPPPTHHPTTPLADITYAAVALPTCYGYGTLLPRRSADRVWRVVRRPLATT